MARALGESRVDSDLGLLLASELVTNSVRHSGSAVPGGVVTVTVAAGDEVVRDEVTDRHEMARYLKRHEGIDVSHNFVSILWRENGIQPHRTGTFKEDYSRAGSVM